MSRWMHFGAVALFAVALTGCGEGDRTAPATDAKAELTELGGLLKMIAEQKKKPPAKLAELDQFEPYAMSAIKAVMDKRVVYLYGHGYAPGETGVVAYEAAAESAGGLVLLQDGTVKKLSAAEFTAAPKAAKK